MKGVTISTRADWEKGCSDMAADTGFDACDAGPVFGRFGRRYVPEANPESVDRSFVVSRDGAPALLVSCREEVGGILWSGEPVRFWISARVPDVEAGKFYRCGVAELIRIARAAAAPKVSIADPPVGACLSGLGRQALNIGACAKVRHVAIVDLARPEADVRAALRKSFRSLINWGKRNLRLDYVNRDQPDRDKFELFRQFHKKIAGRETRSARSWALQFEAAAAGNGEAILAYDAADEVLVSAALVLDGDRDAVYYSGVYDRQRFDKPLGHWPLYDAILRSKARGLKRFILGELPAAGAASEKERNIAYFKRGFATDILQEVVWEWRP